MEFALASPVRLGVRARWRPQSVPQGHGGDDQVPGEVGAMGAPVLFLRTVLFLRG